MFKRKAYKQLLEWKKGRNGSTAMLIEGARRVGKSSLALEFGRNEYEKCLLIDFAQARPEVLDLFRDMRYDVNSLLNYLFTFYNFIPVEHNTLIIFDEVQLCPQARASIKQLVANHRFDYIETGSLISIHRNVQDILLPSEEESITLHPFDFEEFLWALESKPLADSIRNSYIEQAALPIALHKKAEQLFREYMLVGGMPQVIEAYASQKSFQAADEVKRSILRLYRNDIAKYGEGEEARISAIFSEIPSQLAKHDKKFKITSLGEHARNRTYESAFFWLKDAGLVNLCFKSNDPSIGLALNADDSAFKCYFFDTGLLVSQALADDSETNNAIYQDILRGKIGINEGMIVENVVAQQLTSNRRKLFYYAKSSSENRRERMEIDFLIKVPYVNAAGKYRISPIEVKSNKRYKTVSLDKIKTIYGSKIGEEYVLHPKTLEVRGDRHYLPLYMSGLLGS